MKNILKFSVIILVLLIIPLSIRSVRERQQLETQAQSGVGKIHGTVHDKATYKGINGVTLTLETPSSSKTAITRTETDPRSNKQQDGVYHFNDVLPGGGYKIKVTKVPTGYTTGTEKTVDLSSGELKEGVDFALEKSSSGNQPGGQPRKEESIKIADPQECKGFGLRIFDNSLHDNTAIEIPNPLCLSGTNGVKRVVILAVQILLTASAIISFFILIWSGVQYILSGGDAKAIGAARGRITFALIGLAITFLATIIFVVLGNILGFNLLRPGSAPINWREGVNEAVRQEQQQIAQLCQRHVLNFDLSGFNQCKVGYCEAKYRTEDRKRSDCIQLSQGLYDDEVGRMLKDIGDFCAKEVEVGRSYDNCIRNKCDAKFQNPENRTDCKQYFLGP